MSKKQLRALGNFALDAEAYCDRAWLGKPGDKDKHERIVRDQLKAMSEFDPDLTAAKIRAMLLQMGKRSGRSSAA
jgi:hypothetical protein